MKIAVIGWRYLIWDPRGMDLEPQWHSDGSVLPVEFARFSSQPVLTSMLVEGAVLLALAATWGYLTLWKRSGGARNDAQPVEIAKDGPRS